ncbi:Myb_DNA-binding domain-containing protein/Bromodomain domain-containing protein [Cephalotus follicularis]|uniref:Myb_DNA-binding domain-containing protein/Bromodomain domain-containing protein n=1 Tax=Cephalotus follicularis TaxID=3775 RepID=A0A1Q3CDP2_CEPFO|nr:Myb_DNA-binding domain-containing protein/Bromodomain domain-containing protein [Cephalotus follicularis]
MVMGREEQNETWGTWEELLLACAVKRHGFKNWESVSMEVQSKSSLPPLLTTPNKCEQKYHDLKTRFKGHRNNNNNNSSNDDDDDDDDNNSNNNINNNVVTVADSVPWLENLRQKRVDELRRQVQRYDVSIVSLQLKVKRLEEEREGNPDLEMDGSETDKKAQPQPEEEDDIKSKYLLSSGGGGARAGEESDRENRSVNESNSTSRTGGGGEEGSLRVQPGPVQDGSVRPDPVPNGEPGVGESEMSGGDVQSSASLGGKRKRKGRRRKEVSGGHDDGDDDDDDDDVKSEPLVGFLEMIRAHQHGSLFERRLQAQETDEYKSIIRQHVDLETIQSRLDQGSYSSTPLAFYRDLMLLFNNSIVYFPKSSLESVSAHELRILVSTEMRKETHKSDSSQERSPPLPPPQAILPQPRPDLERLDSLLERQKSSAPIIVCRKRSAKPSSNLGQNQKLEPQLSDDKNPTTEVKTPVEESIIKMKAKEEPVTGARSSRRNNFKNTTNTSNNNNNNTSTHISAPNKKQNVTPGSKGGASGDKKSDKKKTEALALEKKQSVVDFLKRIKKNSPAQASKRSSSSKGGGVVEEKNARSSNTNSKKGDKGKERMLRKNSDKRRVKEESSSPSKRGVGRPSKSGGETTAVTGKRKRDSGGKEVKQTRKRARR